MVIYEVVVLGEHSLTAVRVEHSRPYFLSKASMAYVLFSAHVASEFGR